jgi:hypothetical protein
VQPMTLRRPRRRPAPSASERRPSARARGLGCGVLCGTHRRRDLPIIVQRWGRSHARWLSSRGATMRCLVVANRSRRPTGRPRREIDGELVLFLVRILTVIIGLAMAFLSGVGLLSLSLRGGRG